jgi:hypothetical protein
MALSAQDKILYVANKLGLSTLGQMQGSTGAVYDVDTENTGLLFGNASKHAQPTVTNINENKFEVNEALLVESLAFYAFDNSDNNKRVVNLASQLGSDNVVLFDLVIGNKRVMKDTPIFVAGQPGTFASVALQLAGFAPDTTLDFAPRHQIFMEGAGILIPPQVEWSINYRIFNMTTGAASPFSSQANIRLGAYLFGTRVLLNFNTTI